MIPPAAAALIGYTLAINNKNGVPQKEAQWDVILQSAIQRATGENRVASTCTPKTPTSCTPEQLNAMSVNGLQKIHDELSSQILKMNEKLKPIRVQTDAVESEIGLLILKRFGRDDLSSLPQGELQSLGHQLLENNLNQPESPWWEKSGLGTASSIAVGFGIGNTLGNSLYKALAPWNLNNRRGLQTISDLSFKQAQERIQELVKQRKLWKCKKDEIGFPKTNEQSKPIPIVAKKQRISQKTALAIGSSIVGGVVAVSLGRAFLKFMVKRAAVAGTLSVADGPLPIGETLGAILLIGSCIEFAFSATLSQ